MKYRRMLVLLFLSAIASGYAGPAEPESAKDFQTYYTSTKWYFAKYQAPLPDLTGFKIQDNRGMQAFLTSPSGTQMIYGELEPSDFMKSFLGNGTLAKISGIPEPIFEMDSDYTQRNPNKLLLIGFVGGRAIQIEASHSQSNRSEVIAESIGVALQMYKQLREMDASNKGLLRTGDPRTARPSAEP